MTEDQDKIMRLLEKVSQDVARLQKERDEARAEATRFSEMADNFSTHCQAACDKADALEVDLATAKAEAARAAEALRRIHEGACRQLAEPRNHYNDQFALTAIATDCEAVFVAQGSALDWLAAQRREAAAEALENEARKGWSTPVTLRDRAAVLRAGEVTP